MNSPAWLSWLLTGAFLAVSTCCVVRLVVARDPAVTRAVDVAHVVMGLGMAVMVSPVGGPLPHAGWETMFLLLAAWFAGTWLVIGGAAVPSWHGNTGHHALSATAMLYILLTDRHGQPEVEAAWSSGHLMGAVALSMLGWPLVGYLVMHAGVIAWRALPTPGLRLTGSCQLVMTMGAVAMLAPTL